MLRWKDFMSEIKEAEGKADSRLRVFVKLFTLVGKMLRDIRLNQIKLMEKLEVPKIESKNKDSE